jgi:hypothetical protein
MEASSEPVAGERITDRQREERDAENHQAKIEHRSLLILCA